MAGVHMRRVLRRAVPQCTMGAGAVLLVLALLRRGGGGGGIPRDGPLYLGLDMSTQSLKCTVLGADLRVAYTAAINYDEALPEFATRGGVHHDVRRPCASPPSLPSRSRPHAAQTLAIAAAHGATTVICSRGRAVRPRLTVAVRRRGRGRRQANEPGRVTSPPEMWIAALDLLLERLQRDGAC